MKLAYFDCFSGISGDMTLGALVDAGCDAEYLRSGLRGLQVSGWELTAEKVWKNGMAATYVKVKTEDQSKHRLGWSGYTWNDVLFPYPQLFLDRLHGDHLKTSLNLHPASGIQPWEAAYPAMARAMGIDPATKQYVPYDMTSKKFAENGWLRTYGSGGTAKHHRSHRHSLSIPSLAYSSAYLHNQLPRRLHGCPPVPASA